MGCRISSGLGGVGSVFFSFFEIVRISGSLGNYIVLNVGNGDNGVVKSRLNVGYFVRDIFFCFFGFSFFGRMCYNDCLKVLINRIGMGGRLFFCRGFFFVGNG